MRVQGDLKVPAIAFGQEEMERMRKRVADDFPQILGKELVLIYPSGGILPIRAWPPDSYCRFAQGLIAEGYAVGVIGLAEEERLSATDLAHVEVIAERLRLLYVGITRARRFLALSWSREIPLTTRTRAAPPAAPFLKLSHYYRTQYGDT